jgi:hypothetical protein
MTLHCQRPLFRSKPLTSKPKAKPSGGYDRSTLASFLLPEQLPPMDKPVIHKYVRIRKPLSRNG